MFKKIGREVKNLSWTLGGTGLVLITLSGNTRTLGIWISLASLVAYLSVALSEEESSD